MFRSRRVLLLQVHYSPTTYHEWIWTLFLLSTCSTAATDKPTCPAPHDPNDPEEYSTPFVPPVLWCQRVCPFTQQRSRTVVGLECSEGRCIGWVLSANRTQLTCTLDAFLWPLLNTLSNTPTRYEQRVTGHARDGSLSLPVLTCSHTSDHGHTEEENSWVGVPSLWANTLQS